MTISKGQTVPNEVDHTTEENLDSEREKMHGWDFAFSITVMLFSIVVIGTSLTMPFSGTVGGVTTQWYESPGLLPLFIGCSLFAAGLSVFVKSNGKQGHKLFFKYVTQINPTGFLLSAGGIISYIFVLITWFDFYLASTAFLLLYIGLYYLDTPEISRKLLKIYYLTVATALVIFSTGLDTNINKIYSFNTDIILLLSILLLIGAMVRESRQLSSDMVEKVRRLVLISVIFPAVLCPIFRYFLLVPLPHEGLVVEQIFNHTYYSYINTSNKTEEVILSDEQMSELEDAF